MEVEEKFVRLSSLICEPTRARMLWSLLDGRAYTASELALVADISATAASNHLSKLLEADIVKVEMQGRHRYYAFANAEVAYVVEALANLADHTSGKTQRQKELSGIQYCRTCYDHLAGYVGVQVVEAMEKRDYLKKSDKIYLVSEEGWEWLQQFEMVQADFKLNRRPLARQCLDWSERRPHLAGQLGAALLHKMLERRWFKKVPFSREMVVTAKGRQALYEGLGIVLS